jgi:hypothetical protein
VACRECRLHPLLRFNKDTIRPESEPVLKEIVHAMTNNTLEGPARATGWSNYSRVSNKKEM